VTKLAGEQLMETYRAAFGIDAVVLRYFSAYGPRQRPDMAFHRFCRAAVAGEPVVVFGDGGQTRDFTYVDDIVRATRAAAATPEAGGATVNVGGGARVSVNDALAVLGDLVGEPLDVRHVAWERGDVHDTGADIRRASEVLGFHPATPFAEGMCRELEWVRARVPAGSLDRMPTRRAVRRTAGRPWFDDPGGLKSGVPGSDTDHGAYHESANPG
jgi:UDP-glucose 4-epimerase